MGLKYYKMKLFFKFLIFLIFILNSQYSYSEVFEVEGNELQKLIDEGVPIIDIRREEEWFSTGIIKNSNLLTFFDKDGKYDLENWMNEFENIVQKDNPFDFYRSWFAWANTLFGEFIIKVYNENPKLLKV